MAEAAKKKTAVTKKAAPKKRTVKKTLPKITPYVPQHDVKDPDPWQALLLDNSTFIDEKAKAALMRNNATRARQFLFPIVRPLARLSIVLVQLLRIVLPNSLTCSRTLHRLICWGMRNFVSRDANYLILRHFHIGSQILGFLNANAADGALPSNPLLPRVIDDLKDDVFVQHDLNLYNFVISLNDYLRGKGGDIQTKPLKDIDFSMVKDPDSGIDIDSLPDKWTNVLDLQTAVEMYTPLFGVFLSDSDFWRASNSLQFDETVAVYVAKLLGQDMILAMVNNKHPMIPLSTMEAGFRLMLHGLDAENLHGFIRYIARHGNPLKE